MGWEWGLERLTGSLWWFVACRAHGPSQGSSLGGMESSTDATCPALFFLRSTLALHR